MPTAPTSRPPPLNASRSFLQALNALSPASLFRVRQQSQLPHDEAPKPPMPLHVANTLAQLIDYLEEHHRREEGLYRRTNDQAHKVLADDYEPLLSYASSQSLLERTAGKDENATLDEILATIQRLSPTTRELVKVLLIHLHHLSTSIPTRMDAKSLAEHVGVLLVRPTADTGSKNTHVFKQRRRIARLMIEHANALPYNEANSTNARAVKGGTESQPTQADGSPSHLSTQAHHVQLMWDNDVCPHTEASLRDLLSRFGSVSALALNESGNRAIAAYSSSEHAQAAAAAGLKGVRVRCRKPRSHSLSQSIESDFDSPKPSPTKDIASESSPILHDQDNSERTTPVDQAQTIDEQADCVTLLSEAPIDGTDTESPTFLLKLERPPSIVLEQRATKPVPISERIALEDVESPLTSPHPQPISDGQRAKPSRRSLDRINEAAEEDEESSVAEPAAAPVLEKPVGVDDSHALQRRRSLKQLLMVDTALSKRDEENNSSKPHRTKLFSPKIALITDLKLMIARKRTPRATKEPPSDSLRIAEPTLVPPAPSSVLQKEMRSIKTQTKIVTQPPLRDQATETEDLQTPKTKAVDEAGTTASCLTVADAHIEKLTLCLHDVKTELVNLASALSASRQTQVDRAILQAHERVITCITEALEADSTTFETQGNCDETGLATREFVAFLETRSSTQVKILEAEVRAGQELLRLHRSQHQKEMEELEAEVTGLRVTQKETEKMCADLRSELRKCRAELTCHVATAASIQSERREMDEKLIVSENKLRAKDQELLELQLAHNEMRETAANAQRRLEEYRGSSRSLAQCETATVRSVPSRTETEFPRTTAFLKQHCQEIVRPKGALPAVLWPGQYSNTVELSGLKKKLEERIHDQMEATRQSLRELQVFGAAEAFDGDDEDLNLEQLEQQLASAHADMNATMDGSRQELQRLFDPVGARTEDDAKDHDTRFDPTGLVQRLLAAALSDSDPNPPVSSVPDCSPSRPVEAVMPSWKSRSDDTQSELYRRWMRDRAQEPSMTLRPRNATDNAKMREAHESMRRFHEALATIKPTAARGRAADPLVFAGDRTPC